MGFCKNNNLIEPDRRIFDLLDLSKTQSIEIYCGSDCESRIRVSHRMTARTHKEMFLNRLNGAETLRLDFDKRFYRRISFSSDKLVIEIGTCELVKL